MVFLNLIVKPVERGTRPTSKILGACRIGITVSYSEFGPTTVKSSRSSLPMLPKKTSPMCSPR
jgi:hypothetical protein